MKILLVGAGGMSVDYSRVFSNLGVNFSVVCRSDQSANRFMDATGSMCTSGGLDTFIEKNPCPSHAVISVGITELYNVTKKVLEWGVKNVLIEKPASLFRREVDELAELTQKSRARAYVAFNRRCYASVRKLSELAQEDGGLTSLHFDFTEWSDQIAALPLNTETKRYWVLSNSSHVIDLAFYLAGQPKKINCFHNGTLDWHPSAARFSGAGISKKGISFSYRADWDASGRWSLIAYSKNFKFELCPLEELNITQRNSVDGNSIQLENKIDLDFKPGLYVQVKSFLGFADASSLCKLSEHKLMFPIFNQIAGYEGPNAQ